MAVSGRAARVVVFVILAIVALALVVTSVLPPA
jgi:hypothetical protein